MKTFFAFFLLTLVFFYGCKVEDPTSQEIRAAVEFQEIGKGTLGGMGQEGIEQSNLVINSQSDWQALMSQMNSHNNVTNDFNEIDIDFGQFTIIAVILELKGYGWEVEINRIIEREGSIVVSTTEQSYDTAVMSQPFHIIKIPKTDKAIVFE